jgi:hypothetical protein
MTAPTAKSSYSAIRPSVKIAKRGRPGTGHARTWISLEPGWSVQDCGGGREIEIEQNGVRPCRLTPAGALGYKGVLMEGPCEAQTKLRK